MALSRVRRRVSACAAVVVGLLGVLVGAVALLAVLLVVLPAAPASAHATVVASDPAPGSLLAAAPRQISLTFDEPVSVVPDAVRVYGPDGSRVDHGPVLRPGGGGDEVGIAIDGGAAGTYLVSWRIVSADSHPTTGAFTFSVRQVSTAPSVAAVGSDGGLGKLLGVARALGYTGSALLLGGTVLLGLAGAQRPGSARGRRRFLGAGVILLIGSALVALLVQGGYDAGLGWSSIGRPALVQDLLATTFGRGLLLRIAATVAFALFLTMRGPRGVARVVLLALAGLALVVSFAMTGHGVASPLQLVSTAIHVAVASIWIGGLAVLALLVLPQRGDARALVTRFSGVATACVGLLVATGGYQAWQQVGAWRALTATTYGRELMLKLGLVALVLGAAAFSRRWVRSSGERPLRTVEPELVLGMAVIGVTAVIATTMPATVAYHPSVATRLTTGPDVVQVSAVPSGDRMMDLDLRVHDAAQCPSNLREVDVTVSLPDRSLGPLLITLHPAGAGHLIGAVAVPVVGTWTLSITVRTSAIDEYTATTELPIR